MFSLALSSTSMSALMGGGSAAAVPFSPNDLFAASEPGVWFDPSDLTTLFQDHTGTTPVTTPGQTVGLMLDKSKGLVLGPELVTNGTFDSGTTGWTPQSLTTISVEDGQLKAISSAAADTGVWQALTTVVGKTYRITASLRGTAGQLNIAAYNGAFSTLIAQNTNYPETGVLTEGSLVFTAIGTTTRIIFSPGAIAATYYADNISVKELAGNHATQATLAARPTYAIEPAGGRRNLLTQTEAFPLVTLPAEGWAATAGGTSVTSRTALDPDGGSTAATITATSSPGYFYYNTQANPTSGSTTVSLWIRRRTGTGDVRLRTNSGTFTDSLITVTSSWQRVSVVCAASGAANNCWVLSMVTAGDAIDIWHPQLELGSTATNYQKVTTQYDVTEAGVASVSYLYFDGVNDAMVTSTITPGIDKAQVFAGVRKLSDAEQDTIIEYSTGLLDGSIGLWTGTPSITGAYYHFNSRGTAGTGVAITPASYPAPINNVITGLGNISGDTSTIRINGTQIAQSTTDQGTGNYLAYPLYIGGRSGTSFFLFGHLYSLITRFGANLDTPTITNTETWVAGKTGFYAPVITGVPTIGVS